MNCPYPNPDHHNLMKMIRHHHGSSQRDLWVPVGQGIPDLPHNPAGIVQLHFAIHDLAKQAFTLPGYHCDKYTPGWE